MTYRITGLDPEPFRPLFTLSDAQLEERGMRRMTVTEARYPRRRQVLMKDWRASQNIAASNRRTIGS